MKIIVYTQRVEIIEAYNERRDCADQNIPRFIHACGYIPIPIPNISNLIPELFEILKPNGVIMTGGNSLIKYGGNALEKDDTDRAVIRTVLQNNIPLYGFCRGMQSILDYYKIELREITGHVVDKHEIHGEINRIVNSFHNQAAFEISNQFEVLAVSDDKAVEAIRHKKEKIIATMWHPEREMPFNEQDINMVKEFFG